MEDSDIQFIQQEFEVILIETINSISKDNSLTFWRTPFGKDIVLRNLQLARIHLKSISILRENSDYTLVISATPISRAISEILFGIIYVFENFEERTFDSAKSFVREGKRETKIFKERYSGKSVEWDNWINDKPKKLERIQNRLEAEFSILGHREFDWDNDNTRFPRLNKMKQSFNENSETRKFLDFVEDVYNRELSGISHSEPHAAALLGAFLHDRSESMRESFKGKILGLSFIVLLSLLSEVESKLNYGTKSRVRGLWTKLVNLPETDIAKEFYEMRYQELLSEQTST